MKRGQPNNCQISLTWRLLLAIALSILVFNLVILAAVPPVSRDALTHHLAVPKLYIEHGRMLELPEIVFSYFPMNLDLLYLVPLLWGQDILPKYIHMAFGLLTAAIIYLYLRSRTNRTYGLLGALLFLSLPVIVQLSITVYVDLGLIFFSTAALFCLLEWFREDMNVRYLLMGAVFCGLAMGTKYNGLVVFLLLSFMVPLVAAREKQFPRGPQAESRHLQKVMAYSVIFTLVALLLYAPWAMRNWAWTDNPVYPLYDRVFNSQNPYHENRLSPFAMRRLVYGESLGETLLVPIRIFFQGQDDVPALFDGRLNPLLFFLSLIGLYPLKQHQQELRREKALLGGFAVLFILIVFFTRDMRIRYIAPAIPALVVLSTFGIETLCRTARSRASAAARRLIQLAVIAVVVASLGLNADYILQQWQVVRPIDYLFGKVDRPTYISRHRPEYALIRHANQNLSEADRILCIFIGNRRYYFDVNTLFFEWPQFKELLESSPDAASITYEIRQKGITHLMFGLDQLRYWSRETLAAEQRVKLREWMERYLEPVKAYEGYILFRLR